MTLSATPEPTYAPALLQVKKLLVPALHLSQPLAVLWLLSFLLLVRMPFSSFHAACSYARPWSLLLAISPWAPILSTDRLKCWLSGPTLAALLSHTNPGVFPFIY